jgi:hypothetical protein
MLMLNPNTTQKIKSQNIKKDHKYCVNCKHFVPSDSYITFENRVRFGRCGRRRDYVTGEVLLTDPAKERKNPRRCGPRARYFQDRSGQDDDYYYWPETEVYNSSSPPDLFQPVFVIVLAYALVRSLVHWWVLLELLNVALAQDSTRL